MNSLIRIKIKRLINKWRFGDDYVARNETVELARRMGVNIGEGCRIYSTNFSSEPYLIDIGNHVTITNNVFFSTHDGGVWVYREKEPNIELFGKIKIGNNVFIGMNSLILFSTSIGDNSIVAAGAVVKGNYEPNSVIGGIPAKCISSIEEYYQKNISKFTYIRNLPADQKRREILKKLNQ